MTVHGFWRQMMSDNRRPILQGWGQVNQVHYLFPQGDGLLTSFGGLNVYSDFTTLKSQLRSRDVIVLGGVLREQAVAPDGIFDVLITGAANQPRQATSGGSPTNGGACWLAPSSGPVAATALLELTRQGWRVEGIEFTPHTSSPGILLTRSTSVDLIDSSHFEAFNCLFAGNGGTGQVGIQEANGSRSGYVEGCRFEQLASAILGVATGAAVPSDWRILANKFRQNTNDVKMSLNYSLIGSNVFQTPGSGATNKVVSTTFIGGQGGNNTVALNWFPNTEAQIAPGSGYTGAATDQWGNYVNDQAALAVGQPA